MAKKRKYQRSVSTGNALHWRYKLHLQITCGRTGLVYTIIGLLSLGEALACESNQRRVNVT